jgi:non-ribosomal peptide synthetase component F
MSDTDTFLDVLEKVKQTTLDAHAHDDAPFVRLVRELNYWPREANLPFAYLDVSDARRGGNVVMQIPGLVINPLKIKTHERSRQGIAVWVRITPAGVEIVFLYEADRYEQSYIELLAKDYGKLLEQVAKNPSQSLESLFVQTVRV